MFCPNCRSQVEDGASFCPNCGTSFVSRGVAPAQAQYIPAQPQQQPQPIIQQTTIVKKSNPEGLIGLILTIAGGAIASIPGLQAFGAPLMLIAAILLFIGLFHEPRGTAIAGCLIWLIEVFAVVFIIGGFVAMLGQIAS